MNINEVEGNEKIAGVPETPVDSGTTEMPRPQPPTPTEPENSEPAPEGQELHDSSMQTAPEDKPAFDRKKLLLLGGGLGAAVLFFALTAIVGRSPVKKTDSATQQVRQQGSTKPQGSVTPLMDTVRKPNENETDGQVKPTDIKRLISGNNQSPGSGLRPSQKSPASNAQTNTSLAAVPSFAETQQKWEEPRPYGGSSENNTPQNQQQQSALKETSLVFVRAPAQSSISAKAQTSNDDEPVLDMTPGSRILAKLEAEISTSDPTTVVAVAEYTYAIGDQIVVPSGARVFGQITNADAAGNVGVKFNEIDLLDGRKEKIDAVGKALDMGPIKGKVSGKNGGKNLLVRSLSGIGSTLAMVVGTNTSSAFSEDDMIRQRLAENVGSAGDSQIMDMALNSHEIVSVPVDRKIYIVFTKHEQIPSTLHKVDPTTP